MHWCFFWPASYELSNGQRVSEEGHSKKLGEKCGFVFLSNGIDSYMANGFRHRFGFGIIRKLIDIKRLCKTEACFLFALFTLFNL